MITIVVDDCPRLLQRWIGQLPSLKSSSDEVSSKAKNAKKKKVFADIRVVKASKERKGDLEETLIGAFSS